ncbi:pinensin family lanthipeptide [Luteibaculum oceani]|uniref:pinensin family lanthipeptide n=1 Tax=Luteibaculum oceani TaxID=1294296 RepID=UPI001476EF20|nr:pinensin family lanthipeptide [Luteibaculum oceani]
MKKKLSLEKIKVESFVTQIEKTDHIQGGKATVKQCSIVFCSAYDACITARGCTTV